MRITNARAVLLALPLLAACASAPKTRPGYGRVALLPLANGSVVVDAPDKVMRVLRDEFTREGFALVPEDEVATALAVVGVTQGGQLAAVTHAKLAAALKADIFVKGWIERFGFQSAVAMSRRVVELRLQLTDRSGKVLYDEVETGITTKAGADAAGDLVLNTAGKIFRGVAGTAKKVLPGDDLDKAVDATEAVADVDLKQESRAAARRHLRKLPKSPIMPASP